MSPGLPLKADGSKERPKEKVKHVRYNHCTSYYHKALKSEDSHGDSHTVLSSKQIYFLIPHLPLLQITPQKSNNTFCMLA